MDSNTIIDLMRQRNTFGAMFISFTFVIYFFFFVVGLFKYEFSMNIQDVRFISNCREIMNNNKVHKDTTVGTTKYYIT